MHYSIAPLVTYLYQYLLPALGVQMQSIDFTQVHHLHKKYTTHIHMRYSLDRMHYALCTMHYLLCPMHYAPHRCLALPGLKLDLHMLNAMYQV